jgi:hypothetical protein
MTPKKSLSEVKQICTDLVEQANYDVKAARNPKKKGQYKRTLEFWSDIAFYLEKVQS